jgi:CHASE2 domain-containing sensor protein
LNTIVSSSTLRIIAIGFALSVALAGFSLHLLGLAASGDTRATNLISRFIPAKQEQNPPVILVTIQDLGQQAWPWPGLDYAVFLNSLAPFKPAVVAIGIPLQAGEADYKIYDLQFGKQIAHLNSVILPAIPLNANHAGDQSFDILPGTAPACLFNADSCEIPPAEIAANAKVAPLFIPAAQKIPLIVSRQNRIAPTFILQTYAQYLAADWSKSAAIGDTIILRNAANHELARIPVDSEGCLRPRYQLDTLRAQAAEFYQLVISAEQIRNNFPPIVDLAAISGKILLVGAEAPGTYQPVNTAKGATAPIRTQYQVLKDLFAANFLRPAPAAWIITALLLISLTAGQFALLKNLAVSVVLELLLLIAIPALSALLLATQQLILPAATLCAVCLLTWTLTVICSRLNQPNPENPYLQS